MNEKIDPIQVTENQARALGEGLADILHGILRERVVNKGDIARLEHQIKVSTRSLKIWIVSMAVLLFTAIEAMRFFVK